MESKNILSQHVSPPHAAILDVLPEDTVEQITTKIYSIETQILSSSDPEEKRQLREEKRQLREEKRQLREKENLELKLQCGEDTSGKFSPLL